MLKLTHRYAKALLTFAEEEGLETVYREALMIVLGGQPTDRTKTESLGAFLAQMPGGGEQVSAVLYEFLDLARERMNMLRCEIISAVPLRPEQHAALEQKLIRIFRMQMDITATVDPDLLGGLRVIVEDTVLDDSVKRKLADMKNKIYEGVYFKQ